MIGLCVCLYVCVLVRWSRRTDRFGVVCLCDSSPQGIRGQSTRNENDIK